MAGAKEKNRKKTLKRHSEAYVKSTAHTLLDALWLRSAQHISSQFFSDFEMYLFNNGSRP